MNKEYILINKDLWKEMVTGLTRLKQEVATLSKRSSPVKAIYSNQDIRKLLGVNDKLIRKYRQDGLLDYSCVGGKYWYSYDDIEKFLKNAQHS